MDQIYDNRYYSAGSREPTPRRARTVQLGGSDYAGADCSTQRPTSASHSRAQVNTSTDRPLRSVRPAHSEHAQRSSAQTHEKPSRPSNRLSGSDFMHYANDNAVVKAIYDFTHGPQRGLFVGIVVALALVVHSKRAALIAADKFAFFSLVRILCIVGAVFQAGGNRFSFVLMQCDQTSSSQSRSPPK